MKIFNKKAKFNYTIIESFEAGVVLSGQEVKSIRAGRLDLADSFAKIQNDEVYLKNAFIPPYQGQHTKDYNPKKDRKLLLHRDQINTLIGKMAKGMALIPMSIYSKKNMFKVELGLGASKKKYDKRRAIKLKDQARRIEQELS